MEEIRAEKEVVIDEKGSKDMIEEGEVIGNRDKVMNTSAESEINDKVNSLDHNCTMEENENVISDDSNNVNVNSADENSRNKMINVNDKEKDNVEDGTNASLKADTLEKTKPQNNSYARIVKKDVKSINNKLNFVPTELTEEGSEVVVFDEELVNRGSVQWKLTICGYFVGYHMNINELRYHLRRMWSRMGVTDIEMNTDGTCMFKFRDEQGMNKVLEGGTWMVNNKPLMVQKWDPTIGLEKVEQTN